MSDVAANTIKEDSMYHVEVTGWTVDDESTAWEGRGATEAEAVEDAKRRGGIVEVGDVTIVSAPAAADELEAHVPGQAIDLGNARSYFSQGFEDSLAEPGELERQLEAHSMESAYVLDAIRELGAFARFMIEARRQSKAARTLAGTTILELLWGAGGRLDYGKLTLTAQRRHKRAGVRTLRVFTQLEDAGIIATDRPSRFYLERDEPLMVRLVGVVDPQELELKGLRGPAYTVRDGRTVDVYTGAELEL